MSAGTGHISWSCAAATVAASMQWPGSAPCSGQCEPILNNGAKNALRLGNRVVRVSRFLAVLVLGTTLLLPSTAAGGQTPVTGRENIEAVWSPDGSRIAFVSLL